MPTNIRIIRVPEFIKVTPEGQIDLEHSTKLLRTLASASASLGKYDIILDVRKAQIRLSITDLWYLAADISEFVGTVHRKTAILCPPREFDNAEFFAIRAQNEGLPVMAFTSFEDAVEWLTANET